MLATEGSGEMKEKGRGWTGTCVFSSCPWLQSEPTLSWTLAVPNSHDELVTVTVTTTTIVDPKARLGMLRILYNPDARDASAYKLIGVHAQC